MSESKTPASANLMNKNENIRVLSTDCLTIMKVLPHMMAMNKREKPARNSVGLVMGKGCI